MARIRITTRLDEHLGDSSLASSVRLYVQRFDEWVSDDTKGLFFFPEYTDHGPRHVSSVLAGADALILEDAWNVVTSEDVAVLITAVLLHDSAMHLAADGFLALFNPARKANYLDDKTWPELFEAFFAEARRWNQRKLHRLLGDEAVPVEEEPDLVEYIQRPADMPNPETWSLRYRKFLGEFIRRHHARLAHEIALYGFPGHQPNVLIPPTEFSGLADLAGLVARSHNMNLRDTFGYLEKKYYGRMTCQNVHPIFLMVLLRIADYLEIRTDRVNSTALQIQRLRSPVSKDEQAGHLSVHEVRPDEHDEEAIFVIGKPASARMFLKLQSLLKDLQAELDTSWAVLGEVYSRKQDLRCLGVRLRRVRSNLDSPADLVHREDLTYFPVQAAFDTTGADLLKLLIKPLYGDFPEIGVRELLQNALDAVHELRQWARDNGDSAMKKIPRPQQKADVLISIDEDDAEETWLTIQDKGIGMTTEVVRDYFLKAGASYRESTAWRQNFEDEQGGSKILRSGRFGIGVLAAFLLGDRIEVATRHVSASADSGIFFSASINDDIVELRRTRINDVGTKIRTRLTLAARERLTVFDRTWDWYTADDPRVERQAFGNLLEQSLCLPSPGSTLISDWSEIFPAGFKSLLWGFTTNGLACNGIMVRTPSSREIFDFGKADISIGYPFASPFISVFDPDGNLPLDIKRDSLITDAPFLDDVRTEAMHELCAFLLSWAPLKVGHANIKPFGFPLFTDSEMWPILFTQYGTTLYLKEIITSLGLSHSILFIIKNLEQLELKSLPQEAPYGFYILDRFRVFPDNTPEDPRMAQVMMGDIFHSMSGRGNSLREDSQKGWRILEEMNDEQWAIKSFGRTPKSRHLENIRDRIEGRVPRNSLKVMELHYPQEITASGRSPFVKNLMAILDQPLIPYDPAERRRQLPRAFRRLEKYIEKWNPENLTGWRLKQVKWLRGDDWANEQSWQAQI